MMYHLIPVTLSGTMNGRSYCGLSLVDISRNWPENGCWLWVNADPTIDAEDGLSGKRALCEACTLLRFATAAEASNE